MNTCTSYRYWLTLYWHWSIQYSSNKLQEQDNIEWGRCYQQYLRYCRHLAIISTSTCPWVYITCWIECCNLLVVIVWVHIQCKYINKVLKYLVISFYLHANHSGFFLKERITIMNIHVVKTGLFHDSLCKVLLRSYFVKHQPISQIKNPWYNFLCLGFNGKDLKSK